MMDSRLKEKSRGKRAARTWKNLRCTCGLWINRERIAEHAQTPVHKAWRGAQLRKAGKAA